MDEAPRFPLTEKIVAGVFLILLGTLFILDNLRIVDAGSLWDYWPLLLIVPGVTRLLAPTPSGPEGLGSDPRRRRRSAPAAQPRHRLDSVPQGLAVPARRVRRLPDLADGVAARRRPRGRRVPDPGARAFDGARAGLAATAGLAGRTSVSQLNEFALCGGGHRVVQSADFRGGSITVIAGGFDIDLREAAIAGDSVAIELFVMMGGVVLRIPESWKVVVNVTPLLGGSDLKARTIAPPEGAVRTLVVNGFILMGGLEVKN